jgi:hypothetical protein
MLWIDTDCLPAWEARVRKKDFVWHGVARHGRRPDRYSIFFKAEYLSIEYVMWQNTNKKISEFFIFLLTVKIPSETQ